MNTAEQNLATLDKYIETADPIETLKLIEKVESLGFEGISVEEFINNQNK
jgi:hypothetical protein